MITIFANRRLDPIGVLLTLRHVPRKRRMWQGAEVFGYVEEEVAHSLGGGMVQLRNVLGACVEGEGDTRVTEPGADDLRVDA